MKTKFSLILFCLALVLAACTYAPKQVACDPLALIDAIIKANQAGGIHTLELAQGCSYDLPWIEDMTNGNNGLPVIGTQITINGHGAVIRRTADAPHFRILQVGKKANLTLNDLTIQNGYAEGQGSTPYEDEGGGILNFGVLTLDNVLVTENYAGYVGGIFNSGGTVSIQDSTISRNNADHLTNGILNAGAGTMEISHSTVSENGLITYGDAIWNNGTLRVENSTISGNAGVGIENDQDADGPGVVHLEYVTFAGNAAALNSATETIYILNTLFGPHQNDACSSLTSISGQGVNLDTDGSCQVTTVTPNSLKLGPLADNGGPTQTHALGSSSVAIDAAAGNCPKNDQRGTHRPQGAACDVGAYEYEGLLLKEAPAEEKCKFTAASNLFCRLGPGSSLYPEIDSFTPGQESEVLGTSPDGYFVQVIGGTNQLPCYVPVESQFGALSGPCDDLPRLEPPPIPEPVEEAPEGQPSQGCLVYQDDGSLKCVSPCPSGAGPGDPCPVP